SSRTSSRGDPPVECHHRVSGRSPMPSNRHKRILEDAMKPFLLPILFLAPLLAAARPSEGAQTVPAGRTLAKATFAGGCFWCMEHPFDELAGGVLCPSGCTGGRKMNT